MLFRANIFPVPDSRLGKTTGWGAHKFRDWLLTHRLSLLLRHSMAIIAFLNHSLSFGEEASWKCLFYLPHINLNEDTKMAEPVLRIYGGIATNC